MYSGITVWNSAGAIEAYNVQGMGQYVRADSLVEEPNPLTRKMNALFTKHDQRKGGSFDPRKRI